MENSNTTPTQTRGRTSPTIDVVLSEGLKVEDAQIKEALEVAKAEYISLGLRDWIARVTLPIFVRKREVPAGVSARNYFNVQILDENQRAEKLNQPKEGLARESGVWIYEIPINPTDESQVAAAVDEGFAECLQENYDGMKQIFLENIGEAKYQFKDRLKKENLPNWVNLVSKYKAGGVEAHKEWGVRLDPKEGLVPRDESHPYLEIAIVSQEKQIPDYKFGEVVENGPVVRAVLSKDNNGKVSSIRLMFPHITADEIEGRRVMMAIGKRLSLDKDRDLSGTSFLRSYELADWKGERFRVFDIESSSRFSSEETYLINESLDKIKPRMNRSVYITENFMAFKKLISGYICTQPDKPRDDDPKGSVASGLQLAFMINPSDIRGYAQEFANISDNLSNGELELVESCLNKINQGGRFVDAINRLSVFMNKEIERSQKALSVVSVLGARLPDVARFIFRTGFKRQNRIVGEGTVQTSSIPIKDKSLPVKNFKFITASGLTTKYAIALVSNELGLSINLRSRTNEKDYKKIVKRLKDKGYKEFAEESILLETKQMAKEEFANFRRSLAFMSRMILENHYKDGEMDDEKRQKLIEVRDKFNLAINTINQENQPQT